MNVGIDIGGVILTKEKRGSNPKEVEGAFESIKRLKEIHNIFVISRVETEKKRTWILQILQDMDFFEYTRVKMEDIFFVKTIAEKAQKANELKIDIFIDDSYKVLKPMYEMGIKTICLNTKYKTEQKRQGRLVRSWNEVMSVVAELSRQ